MKKLMNTYKKLSAQAKSSLWYMVTQFLKKGVGFIIVPLYTRILTPTQYGEYNVFYSWYDVLVVFASLRIYGNVFSVGMTKYEDDRKKYTSSMLGLGCICAVVMYSVVILFHSNFEKWLEMSFPMITLLFVQIAFDTAHSIWVETQRFGYKYKAVTLFTIIATLMTPIIGIILVVFLPNQALGAILGKWVPQIFLGLVGSIFILRNCRILYDKKYWGYALQSNIPLIFYYLAQTLLNQMDRLMIQKIEGMGQVGIYSVANAASYVLSIVSSAINVSFIPYMFQNMKAGNVKKIRSLGNSFALVVAACNMALIALAPEAMKLLASKEYIDGMWLIPPLVSSIFVSFLYQMYCNVEFYYEKKYFLMYSSIGVCVCNFVLNYIFIAKFGYLAAGYTTLVSSIFCFAAHYICANVILKKERMEPVLSNRFMVIIILFFFLFAGIMLMFYNHMIIRYVVIVFFLIIIILKRNWLLDTWNEIKGKEK